MSYPLQSNTIVLSFIEYVKLVEFNPAINLKSLPFILSFPIANVITPPASLLSIICSSELILVVFTPEVGYLDFIAKTKSLIAISFFVVYLGAISSPELSTDTRYGISPNDESIADSVFPELVEKIRLQLLPQAPAVARAVNENYEAANVPVISYAMLQLETATMAWFGRKLTTATPEASLSFGELVAGCVR